MTDITAPGQRKRASTRTRTRTRVIVAIGSAVVAVGLIAAVYFLFFFRPTVAADGTHPARLGDPTTATLVPAAGWSVTGDDTDTLELVSPDRVLTVKLTRGADGDPALAVGSATASGSNVETGGKVHTEKLASGLTIAHRDTSAHITAAVGNDKRCILAEIQLDENAAKQAKRELSAYRPALSDLFETLRITG